VLLKLSGLKEEMPVATVFAKAVREQHVEAKVEG
jgi:hypothetical protein